MKEEFQRTELLIGQEGAERLAHCHTAVFGIGGVGGFAAEALARSGIGRIDIIDSDKVCRSNLNRQIIALQSTIGEYKVEIMKRRLEDINPDIKVNAINCFYSAENADAFDLTRYDYIVDAIDTVSSKLELAARASSAGVHIISCMGAGNKMNPTAFEVADISKTSVCPLAKVMRRELRRRGIKNLKVVYSKEEPIKNKGVGSIAFVPSVAGLILASEVIKDLISEKVKS